MTINVNFKSNDGKRMHNRGANKVNAPLLDVP